MGPHSDNVINIASQIKGLRCVELRSSFQASHEKDEVAGGHTGAHECIVGLQVIMVSKEVIHTEKKRR